LLPDGESPDGVEPLDAPLDEFAHVELLRLAYGDVLVCTCEPGEKLTGEQLAELKASLVGRFPDNDIVIVEGAILSVIRPEPRP
jgi:hypothetical protein